MTDDSFTIDEFLAEYRPPRRSVPITMRGDLLGELDTLERTLEAARADSDGSIDGDTADIADRIADLQHQVRDSEREFVVEAVGDQTWSDLVAEHPPDKEDRDHQRMFHGETFWPAAVAASLVTPQVDASQAGKLLGQLSSGQVGKLVAAVSTVNGGGDDIPKSAAGFVRRRTSKPSSTTASPAGSRGRSSSAGSSDPA